MSQKENILIIGGYGKVGSVISTRLGEYFPQKVFAVGRDYYKAQALSSQTNGNVLPLTFDLTDHQIDENFFDDVQLVVMCVDQSDTRFVRACLERGINYIDITANAEFLFEIEQLDELAKKSGATAILSVGLSPGITNIMGKFSENLLGNLKEFNIFILLGLGEDHGGAAVQWVVDNLYKDFRVLKDHKAIKVRSFHERLEVNYPGIGNRLAYRFDFADQHVLARTLKIGSVSTWLSFDINGVAKGLANLQKVGGRRFLNYPPIKKLAVYLFNKIKIGSNVFIIKTVAKNSGNDLVLTVLGENESEATGIITASVAKRLISSKPEAGVFHIEEFIEPEEFLDEVSKEIPRLKIISG